MQSIPQKPSSAFIAISWLSLFVGMITFIIGIWSTKMMLNEKGFYL
ncbi:MAG TPA: YiaA/YiaB family inner membrane protein, partial [Leptospiraceae bacterium]|nr:YiaA/YiaB family inner membrane protein [Leptospiraceae bacterium]